MTAVDDKVIAFSYTLSIHGFDGEVIETVPESEPLSVLLGRGALLPAFEKNLDGLKNDDKFKFVLTAAEAYGEYRDEAVINLPLSSFEVEGKVDHELLTPGNIIPMVDTEGNRRNGTVVSTDDQFVRMDFNHPLAGQDLYFQGYVVLVREPTGEELAHGHVHKSEGCGCGGSCGCDDKDGKCDSENCDDPDCNCKN